jgi:cysteine desulfurase
MVTAKNRTIYLDNGATTPIDPQVAKAMQDCLANQYGNASSIHHKGEKAKHLLDSARHAIAASIGAEDDKIIFTSGGTESNNMAIKGLSFSQAKKRHIITTKIEHDCVLNSCRWLEQRGFKVTYLPVDSEGFVSIADLEKAITDDTFLVSIIHGNNEIGTIQDIRTMYRICKSKGVLFHTDACQSYTKTSLSVNDADLITLNAHKLHGPKGVGALYIRKGIQLTPIMHGGGQERKLRSGTENIPSIVGFAKAVELAADKKHTGYMTSLRDYFTEKVLKIDGTRLNGPKGEKRLCNNINISFRYIEGEAIISLLDLKGICSSTGSACSSKSLEPSHVIMALEDNPERAHGSVRFTISRFTKKEDLDFAYEELKKVIVKLRGISPLTPKNKR